MTKIFKVSKTYRVMTIWRSNDPTGLRTSVVFLQASDKGRRDRYKRLTRMAKAYGLTLPEYVPTQVEWRAARKKGKKACRKK